MPWITPLSDSMCAIFRTHPSLPPHIRHRQIFRTEHWSRRLGADSSLPLMSVVLTTTMAASAGAVAILHPEYLSSLLHHPLLTSLQSWGSITLPWREALYTGLFTTDAVLLMEVFALKDVSSTDAAIVYTLEPVLGAALAFAFLGERWTPRGWVGAALIVGSSVFSQVANSKGKEE
uniref:EamA domain-containing protein n=1 Tax=Auxenochlorella protothecoides TaxID=3075 RepID=A0A1D1ZRG9_AUXPR